MLDARNSSLYTFRPSSKLHLLQQVRGERKEIEAQIDRKSRMF